MMDRLLRARDNLGASLGCTIARGGKRIYELNFWIIVFIARLGG